MSTSDNNRMSLGEKIYTCLILGIVLFCLFLLVMHPFVKIEGTNLTSLDVDANIGWKNPDGSSADLTHLLFDSEGKGSVTRDITSVFTTGKDLCFETSNLFFKVYLNDEQIYRFRPNIPFYYGKYYGDYTHFINIPFFKGTGHLRIEYEALTVNDWTCFRNARMSESNDYLREGVGAGIFQFGLCFTTFIIGVIIIIMGIVFHNRRNGVIETVSLGALSILIACFLMSSTKIWQLLFMDSALPRLSEYVALSLLPIPIVLFVSAYTDKLAKKMPMVICITSCSLFGLILFTIFSGLLDFSVLLMAIHTNIIFAMILLITFFISAAIHREASVTKHVWLMIAFVILIVTGLIDIFSYYLMKGEYTIRTIHYGLTAFVIILAIYEIRNIIEINRKTSEADTMYRLARIDGLTDLANRLSFDEAEKELEEDTESEASLTLLDINCLKIVNDNYGHSEGDRHIRAAARIIAESFGKHGKCFRIGGDEFFTIIKGKDHAERVLEAIRAMNEAISRYNAEENPPIPLNIACGTATYEYGKNTVREAEKLADSRMYTDKKKLKET
ncbi:diguanylate cyclase (GGDEF) domain-containing protein [Ruminococcaceae bacterium YRB3002]|nr:diguanylate cyclase (GGDEF) domain-containing protein [Ruminococcaceae bacterium YRB3002]